MPTGLRLRRSALEEAPPGPPPAELLWTYAGLFGSPVAYCAHQAGRPVAWICGVGRREARSFEALPDRFYGLLPYPGSRVDLRELEAALSATGSRCEVVCAPGGDYSNGDAAHHRFDTYRVEARAGEGSPKLARVALQSVRRAQSAGVEVHRHALSESLGDFCSLFSAKCARHGSPAKPAAFFSRLAEAFGPSAELFLGEHGGRPVAAALVVRRGTYAVFADGSSLDAALALGANHLVIWTAARSCLERGATLLDYGLTEREDAGGRRFKEHLGGARAPVLVVNA